MSNPPQAGPATPDPRPRLPTTNHGPAATRIREYQHDRASRTSTAGPPSTQPTTTPPNGANAPLQAARLDKRRSISAVEPGELPNAGEGGRLPRALWVRRSL